MMIIFILSHGWWTSSITETTPTHWRWRRQRGATIGIKVTRWVVCTWRQVPSPGTFEPCDAKIRGQIRKKLGSAEIFTINCQGVQLDAGVNRSLQNVTLRHVRSPCWEVSIRRCDAKTVQRNMFGHSRIYNRSASTVCWCSNQRWLISMWSWSASWADTAKVPKTCKGWGTMSMWEGLAKESRRLPFVTRSKATHSPLAE